MAIIYKSQLGRVVAYDRCGRRVLDESGPVGLMYWREATAPKFDGATWIDRLTP